MTALGPKIKPMLGMEFGRLTVVRFYGLVPGPDNGCRRAFWDCICECGKHRRVKGTDLRSGNTKSCGCLLLEIARAPISHGASCRGKTTRAYQSWQGMKQRCDRHSLPGYENYGGRGIKYDPEWEKFENFYRDMGDRETGWSLERIDPNGDYCKSNCKWIPRGDQAKNTRRTVWYEFDGERIGQAEVARRIGVHPSLLLNWRKYPHRVPTTLRERMKPLTT